LHRPGLVLICLIGCSSQAHEGDDLTNYGAFRPFMRSFILLVDPGISVPHSRRVACSLGAQAAQPQLDRSGQERGSAAAG
jgi:hypothetical protein